MNNPEKGSVVIDWRRAAPSVSPMRIYRLRTRVVSLLGALPVALVVRGHVVPPIRVVIGQQSVGGAVFLVLDRSHLPAHQTELRDREHLQQSRTIRRNRKAPMQMGKNWRRKVRSSACLATQLGLIWLAATARLWP